MRGRIIADDWILTDVDGQRWTKTQYVAQASKDPSSSFSLADMTTLSSGDTSIVTGRLSGTGAYEGKGVVSISALPACW